MGQSESAAGEYGAYHSGDFLKPEAQTIMFKPDLLAGQRILVTGGGTGLGRAMTEKFLALGAMFVSIHLLIRKEKFFVLIPHYR